MFKGSMPVLAAIIACASAILVTVTLTCLLLTVRCRKSRVVKAASPALLVFSQSGLVLMLGHVIVATLLDNSHQSAYCTVQHWLRHVGFAITYWPLLLRTWRISSLMHSALSVPRPVSDGQLYKMLIAALTVTCVYLSLWSVTDSASATVFFSNSSACCQLSWWQVGQLVGELVVLTVCMALCHRTRHAPAFCNDAHSLGYVALSESLWTVFFVLCSSATPPTSLFHFLRALTTTTLLLALIVQPKLMAARHHVTVVSSTCAGSTYDKRGVHHVSLVMSDTGDVKEVYCVPCGPLLPTLDCDVHDDDSGAALADVTETQYTKVEVDSLISLVERLKQENSGWRQRYQQLAGNGLLGKIYEEYEPSSSISEHVMDTSFMCLSTDSGLTDKQDDCLLENSLLAATALSKKRPSATLTEMTSVPPTPDSCVCVSSDLAAAGERPQPVACSSYAWSRLASCLLQSLLRQPALLRHTATACGLELNLQHGLAGGRTLCSHTSTHSHTNPSDIRVHDSADHAVFSIDFPANMRQSHDLSSDDVFCWHTNTNVSHTDDKNKTALHI